MVPSWQWLLLWSKHCLCSQYIGRVVWQTLQENIFCNWNVHFTIILLWAFLCQRFRVLSFYHIEAKQNKVICSRKWRSNIILCKRKYFAIIIFYQYQLRNSKKMYCSKILCVLKKYFVSENYCVAEKCSTWLCRIGPISVLNHPLWTSGGRVSVECRPAKNIDWENNLKQTHI